MDSFLNKVIAVFGIVLCFVAIVKAGGPGEGIGADDGVAGTGVYYSTYVSCTLGCTVILVCNGDGTYTRTNVDSYSDPCK